MRLVRFLPLWILVAALVAPAHAEEAPAPRLDRVDYGNPRAHLGLDGRVGAGKRTVGIARQLAAKGETPQGTLGQIVHWMGRNLRTDASRAGTWRGADAILVDGTLSGQGEGAFLLGAFARAAGIPAVWVKSLPAAWLKEHGARGGAPAEEVGRVFLEVHVDGRWQLLDPRSARLHERYDVKTRELPDDMLAFDKGSDPYALVLPQRRELWRAQVAAHAARVPLPTTPWAGARDLLAPWRVYITGQGGAATYAREAARTLGYLVESTFSSAWAENLGAARGRTLIVTVGSGGLNLPAEHHGLLPPGSQALLRGEAAAEKGWVDHRLTDGTRVILVLVRDYGPVELAVSEALDG